MRTWKHLLRLGSVSRHVSSASILQNAPAFSAQIKHVAGLSTKARPKARPRLPYAIYALPKKAHPKRAYPLKLKRYFKLAKETNAANAESGGLVWADASRSQVSTEELDNELEWLANNNPASREIEQIFDELTVTRGIQPTSRHFEAIILRNCDPQYGTWENVEAVLKNMEQTGVAMSANVYSAVLKVLALHPDATTRRHIVDEMAKHWMPLTAEIHNVIVAGMIREGQLELAQEKMKEMAKAPRWLYVLFVHALCDRKDFEAVLYFIYDLHDRRIGLPRPTWLHILQQASKYGHHDLTLRVWLYHVEPMYIVPDVECCVRVLELASQTASPKLAESAMAVIEDRYPEEAKARKALVLLSYLNAGEIEDSARHRRGNMFALLSTAKGHHHAFFDPKVALRKRPLGRFLNPKRLERKRLEKLRSKQRR